MYNVCMIRSSFDASSDHSHSFFDVSQTWKLIEWKSKALVSMQRSSPATRGRSARCEGRIVRDG